MPSSSSLCLFRQIPSFLGIESLIGTINVDRRGGRELYCVDRCKRLFADELKGENIRSIWKVCRMTGDPSFLSFSFKFCQVWSCWSTFIQIFLLRSISGKFILNYEFYVNYYVIDIVSQWFRDNWSIFIGINDLPKWKSRNISWNTFWETGSITFVKDARSNDYQFANLSLVRTSIISRHESIHQKETRFFILEPFSRNFSRFRPWIKPWTEID